MNFGDIKSIHFVGIGGIGMSGLAEILSNYELTISGCDAKESPTVERLRSRGIDVRIGHDPSHVVDVDLLGISSAIKGTVNAEVKAAHDQNTPVMRRAEMLGRVMREKKAIGVAGTHGKTTTSAMTGIVLREAGLQPTLIIGGVLRNLDSNAELGDSDYMVVEADEYDRSFLVLDPSIAIITNIEADHLDCYRDLDDIRAAFTQYAERVPPNGAVIGCVDDPEVLALVEQIGRRVVRYGLSEAADLRAVNLTHAAGGTRFDVVRKGERLATVTLHVPGEHNVRNALAAFAAGLEVAIAPETIAAALGEYRGVERRFQLLGEYHGAIVVDDYAHHPSEIRATLEAARKSYPHRRIVALFQPHLFSRTRDFFAEFADALALADVALVTPIYPAREEPMPGVTSALITDAAVRHGSSNVQPVEKHGDELVAYLRGALQSNDLFVTMGAGDVNKVAYALSGGAP